jgi:hypothetical protein
MVTDTSVNVYNRINKVYQANAYYLTGSTAATAVTTYLAIDDPDRADLNTLRQSLNTYKDSESSVIKFDAANTLLMATENEFIFGQVGSTVLSTNFQVEDTNGITYTSIQSALGAAIGTTATTDAALANAIVNVFIASESTENDAIVTELIVAIGSGTLDTSVASQVEALKDAVEAVTIVATDQTNQDNLAKAIYDGTIIVDISTDEADFSTALGTYEVSDDLVTATSAIGTATITNVATTLTGAIGNTAIAPSTAFVGYPCTDSAANSGTLGSALYTTSSDLSTTVSNIFACASWAAGSDSLYFSTTGLAGGCSEELTSVGKAFSLCVDYLAVTPAN